MSSNSSASWGIWVAVVVILLVLLLGFMCWKFWHMRSRYMMSGKPAASAAAMSASDEGPMMIKNPATPVGFELSVGSEQLPHMHMHEEDGEMMMATDDSEAAAAAEDGAPDMYMDEDQAAAAAGPAPSAASKAGSYEYDFSGMQGGGAGAEYLEHMQTYLPRHHQM
jgi:hypothetical protein